ncbi:hypothetical protein L6164_016265 [Bauhinia variegata]|uniref:Uncharacterized protein n=1 Tax=Bauhinia variegata TaxID=167791 RepID=A0ACB9NPI2_BAUVA|nr:hypothetical protein L6164_016265 [Bauhinia variegata]
MASSELAGESDDPNKLYDKLKAVQKEREEKLARYLRDFLGQYIRGDRKGFLQHAESESRRLAKAGSLDFKLPIIAIVSFQLKTGQIEIQSLNQPSLLIEVLNELIPTFCNQNSNDISSRRS